MCPQQLKGYEVTPGPVGLDGRGSSYKILRFAQLLDVSASVYNQANVGRHLVRAQHYLDLRASAFIDWSRAVA